MSSDDLVGVAEDDALQIDSNLLENVQRAVTF